MNREEYLKILTEQIRCKMARGEVSKEISGHIEDQTRTFMSEGLERSEAEELAVREMGDPVETGNELDKVHRPRMPWGMVALIVVLSIAGYGVYYLLAARCVDEAGNGVVDVSLHAGRQFLYLIVGLVVMVGVCFADYTRIAARSRELMVLLFAGSAVGIMFSGLTINGARSWIDLRILTVNVLMLLMLTVPLYAAILYRYRGGTGGTAVKAVLWMLPGTGMAFFCNGTWMSVILLLTYLIVFALAVWKNWFQIPRRLCLAAIGAAALLLPVVAAFYVGFFGEDYQKERLGAIFGTGEELNFVSAFVRELLTGSRLLGKNTGLPDTVMMPADPREIALAGLAGYYGILAALAVAGALLFLLLRFLHISLRQRNQLGMLMGTGCAAVFLIQTGIYIVNNLGIAYFGTYCPFLSMGGSGAVVTYIILGLMLSVCRYRNTAPERRFGKMQGRFHTE